MAVNFLHVNDKNYSVIVCFSKIVLAITISRKLVKMGRKFCLLVYYVKLIGIELWMVEEGVAIEWRLGDLDGGR